MCFSRIFKRMLFANTHIQLAVLNPAHNLAGTLEIFFAGLRVAIESRAREINRPSLRQEQGINRRNWPAGITKKDHITARFETIYAFLPGGFGNGIVNNFNALTICEAQNFGFKIPFGIKNNIIGTSAPCQSRFFFRRCGANNPRPRAFLPSVRAKGQRLLRLRGRGRYRLLESDKCY